MTPRVCFTQHKTLPSYSPIPSSVTCAPTDCNSHQMALDFKHQPLNQAEPSIRLLKVLPNSPPATIHCELEHTTIDASYVCLSYVWGSPEHEHKILVNDAQFWVRSNLWDFLCIAKKRYPRTAFWIDAICIDQTSITERNHQVSIMGKIYSRARRVIASLVSKEYMLRFAIAWRKRFKHSETPWGNPHFAQYVWGVWDDLSHAERDGGHQLMNNEYWSRAWM
jgi:hypothetical protein